MSSDTGLHAAAGMHAGISLTDGSLHSLDHTQPASTTNTVILSKYLMLTTIDGWGADPSTHPVLFQQRAHDRNNKL